MLYPIELGVLSLFSRGNMRLECSSEVVGNKLWQ